MIKADVFITAFYTNGGKEEFNYGDMSDNEFSYILGMFRRKILAGVYIHVVVTIGEPDRVRIRLTPTHNP